MKVYLANVFWFSLWGNSLTGAPNTVIFLVWSLSGLFLKNEVFKKCLRNCCSDSRLASVTVERDVIVATLSVW